MIGFVDEKYKTGLTINAGKSAVVEVPFTGNPQPKVTWQFNGQQLPDPTRIKEETIYNMTALTISRAKGSDAGTYSLSLENPNGRAMLSVKVKVIGERFRVFFLYRLDLNSAY